MSKYSDEVIKDLNTLGFKELEELPKLKDVKKSYYEMAKELHPDKHMDEDENVKKEFEEKFKTLLNAYKRLSLFILKNTNNNENDEEENLIRKEFESMNVMTMNQNSVRLSIPKNHAPFWRQVFQNKFGFPNDQSATDNGEQFKTKTGVSITLWEKKKASRSTILISGPKSMYLSFVNEGITKLFEEVLQKASQSKTPENGMKYKINSTNKTSNCSLCNFSGNKTRLKVHMKAAHTDTKGNCITKFRNVKSRRAILPRKSKLHNAQRKTYFEESMNSPSNKDDSILSTENGEHFPSETGDVVEEEISVEEESSANSTINGSSAATMSILHNYVKPKDFINDEKISSYVSSKESQTDLLDIDCNDCLDSKEKLEEAMKELLKEKCDRKSVDSQLDMKDRRYKTARKKIKALESDLSKKESLEKRLLKTLKIYMDKLKEAEATVAEITKTNNDVVSENKTIQKLYQEEMDKNKKVAEEGKKKSQKNETEKTKNKNKNEDEDKNTSEAQNEVFIDYDNLNADSSSETDEIYADVIRKVPVTLQCDKCKFKTENKRSLMDHQIAVHNRFTCKECEYKAKTNKQIEDHIKEKHRVPKLLCNKCDFRATNPGNLKEHNDSVHEKMTQNHIDKSQGIFKCNQCKYKSKTSFEMNMHEHETHSNKKIQCNLCDFRAASEEVLQKHHVVAMGHKRQELCWFYARGQCNKGKFCRFSHKGSNRCTMRDQNVEKYNNKQCKFFENCLKFPNCGFEHFEICKFQETCRNYGNCRFVHMNGPFLDNIQQRKVSF